MTQVLVVVFLKSVGVYFENACNSGSPMIMGQNPMIMGQSLIIMGHSPIYLGQSPMIMGQPSQHYGKTVRLNN